MIVAKNFQTLCHLFEKKYIKKKKKKKRKIKNMSSNEFHRVPVPGNPNLVQVVKKKKKTNVDYQDILFEKIGPKVEEIEKDESFQDAEREEIPFLLELAKTDDEELKKKLQKQLQKIQEKKLQLIRANKRKGYQTDDEDSETYYEEQIKTPKLMPAASDPKIKAWEGVLDDITSRAIQPLHSFLGMVAVGMGAGNPSFLYKYKRDIYPDNQTWERNTSLVKRGAKSEEEFVIFNRHLGLDLLNLFLTQQQQQQQQEIVVKKEKKEINCEFAPQIYNQNTRYGGRRLSNWLRTLVGHEEAVLAPGWVWAVLPASSVFRFLLSNTAIGAIEMGKSEVNAIEGKSDINIKELLCSGEVTSKFAQFVAHVFVRRSGGNAYPSRLASQQRGGVRQMFNVSAGFKHRAALASEMMGFKLWFQDVYKTANPEIKSTQKKIDELDPGAENKEPLQQALDGFKKHLPFVLRHL